MRSLSATSPFCRHWQQQSAQHKNFMSLLTVSWQCWHMSAPCVSQCTCSKTCHTRAVGRSLEDSGLCFISSHLDYCNLLLLGISDNLLQHLQAIQTAAAHLVTGTGCRKHISPPLQQLHWMPV